MATIDKAKGQAVEEHSLSSLIRKGERWLPTPHRNIRNIVLFRFRKWREPIFTDISEKFRKVREYLTNAQTLRNYAEDALRQ